MTTDIRPLTVVRGLDPRIHKAGRAPVDEDVVRRVGLTWHPVDPRVKPAGDREVGGSPVISFLAHFLIVLAAWTVTIKFLFPVAYALGEGVPLGTYIYWDFWWVVHLWLAWALLRWQPCTYALAIGVSTVEIAIMVTKFALFLAAPEWTIWTTNWFINKLFVLACFCLMLPYFLLYRRRWRDRGLAASAP